MPADIISEQEAQEKYCPFFRWCVNEDAVIHESRPAIYYHEKCKASGCIMWRRTAGQYGYCGVAGHPVMEMA